MSPELTRLQGYAEAERDLEAGARTAAETRSEDGNAAGKCTSSYNETMLYSQRYLLLKHIGEKIIIRWTIVQGSLVGYVLLRWRQALCDGVPITYSTSSKKRLECITDQRRLVRAFGWWPLRPNTSNHLEADGCARSCNRPEALCMSWPNRAAFLEIQVQSYSCQQLSSIQPMGARCYRCAWCVNSLTHNLGTSCTRLQLLPEPRRLQTSKVV